MVELLPPIWLIRVAVGGVWLYEGLWCKLLGQEPRQQEIVNRVPLLAPRTHQLFLKGLGFVEVGIALWVVSGLAPLAGAVMQSVLLVSLNAGGLLWARHLIHDPGGMVVKNFAFLVLVWVLAGAG